jgi:hypothetical protein
MHELGKLFFILGLLIALVGLVIWTGLGKGWLWRLPGDIHHSKAYFTLNSVPAHGLQLNYRHPQFRLAEVVEVKTASSRVQNRLRPHHRFNVSVLCC